MQRSMLCALILAATAASSHAAARLETVASGFDRPVWAGMPLGTTDKLWVMEQAGKVWILDLKSGKRLDEPFLDIQARVTRQGNEQGLLGLAFDPKFAGNGRYYVYYNDLKDRTCISRFISPDRLTTPADQEEILLRYDQPYRNHNGGWISFGPDGMLYIGSGDGGAGNDPKDKGQSLNTHLGKILRIDVSPETGYAIPEGNPFPAVETAKPEIWAYGLRNPWRCSFDRATGDLWIGDVGQNAWEEIDFLPAGKGAGANFGWRLREGLIATPDARAGGEKPPGSIEPVYVYKHGSGPLDGLSITGGYVYRGKAIPELQGRYIFADYQLPRIWSFVLKDGKAADLQNHSESWKPADRGGFNLIASFAEDHEGELLVISLSGSIYKLVKN